MADYDLTYLESLQHDTVSNYGSLAKIDDTHFILYYRGPDFDGWVSTFSINASYEITEIDSLELEPVYSEGGQIIKIDATHFIIAEQGADGDGFIKTISIDGSYDNITEIDSLEHDTTNSYWHTIGMLDSTHFAVAYNQQYGACIVKTFSIDGSYDNITQIDSLQHDTGDDSECHSSLQIIDSTHFIVAYSGAGHDGYISTFSVDSSADNITEIDSIEHDTSSGEYNHLEKIDDTHYVLVYCQVTSLDGYIKTFSIDGSSDNITQLDSLVYNATRGFPGGVAKIDETHVVMNSQGPDFDGYIYTFSLGDDLDDIAIIDSIEHDTTRGISGDTIMIDENHCVIEYSGNAEAGIVKTFSIDVPVVATDTGFLNIL